MWKPLSILIMFFSSLITALFNAAIYAVVFKQKLNSFYLIQIDIFNRRVILTPDTPVLSFKLECSFTGENKGFNPKLC